MMHYVISLFVLVAGTNFAGTVLATEAAGGGACSSSGGGHCTFACVPGSVISVSAGNYDGKASASASCGGASASCEGDYSCNGEGGSASAADNGVCTGSGGTYSCAASAGSEVLVLVTDGNVLALAPARVEVLP